MAAPTIPSIRPEPIGTGLAVEKPHRPALCGFVLAGSSSERRVTRGSSEATTHTTVGSTAQSVADAMVVQRVLDSAEQAAVLVLDPVSGPGPVPLWRPRGSTGQFDGLPGQRISSSASFTA